MNDTNPNSLAAPQMDAISPDLAAEASLVRSLHDFKNQLSGIKLYAAVLKKSLAHNPLDVPEAIALCEKIMRQVDELAARTKETMRSLDSSVGKL